MRYTTSPLANRDVFRLIERIPNYTTQEVNNNYTSLYFNGIIKYNEALLLWKYMYHVFWLKDVEITNEMFLQLTALLMEMFQWYYQTQQLEPLHTERYLNIIKI